MKMTHKIAIVYIVIWALEYFSSCWLMLDWFPWAIMMGDSFDAGFSRFPFMMAFPMNYVFACFCFSVDPITLKK